MLFRPMSTQETVAKLKLTISDTMFFPKTKASPEVGGRRPTSIEIVVLFPAPLCPSKQKHKDVKTLIKHSILTFVPVCHNHVTANPRICFVALASLTLTRFSMPTTKVFLLVGSSQFQSPLQPH